ncbi:MAG: TIGR04348 family glycosyltransferase [Myxococcales bacterium]|nr:TIGR04348 family glycosyltransferase [Myxococcales bacterium]
MKICLVTPARSGSRTGNRVTALRWTRLLRQLGHRVTLTDEYRAGPWDLLIALHARRSHAAVERFARERPGAPIIVGMAGTDLYEDLPDSVEAQRSLALATRIVVLQADGVRALPEALQPRARVIFQSARAPAPDGTATQPDRATFDVLVLAHLREVKDPLLAARAARALPAASRLRVLLAGGAHTDADLAAARVEAAENPRLTLLGELARQDALTQLARAELLVVTSRLEGGANAVSEALAAGVPVLSTRIGGSVGMLGDDYPGLFPVGDAAALAALLARCETDPHFLAELAARCELLRPLVDPARERRAWRRLLLELTPPADNARYRLIVAPGTAAPTDGAPPPELLADVAAGLAARPRRLPCRWLYDDEGSLLFEEICELAEYHIPRAEHAILGRHAPELASRLGPTLRVVELGAGNAHKTRVILRALAARGTRVEYVPVDLSRRALEETAAALLADDPALTITAVAADYEAALDQLDSDSTAATLLLFLGSNIGNLDRAGASAFLTRIAARLRPGDHLLLGADLRASAALLVPAYDDARGVTARFNRNLLVRLNAELGADFDPAAFDHRATYDELAGRIDMWLVARRALTCRVPRLGLTVEFTAGEALHTESSWKHSLTELDALAASAGLAVVERWTDDRSRFCDILLAR